MPSTFSSSLFIRVYGCKESLTQRDVVGPDIVLPLSEAQHSTKYPSRVDPDSHVQLDVRRFDNGCNRVNHVQSHFHGTVCVIGSRIRQSGDAVVTVSQDFDTQTMIVLAKSGRRRDRE